MHFSFLTDVKQFFPLPCRPGTLRLGQGERLLLAQPLQVLPAGFSLQNGSDQECRGVCWLSPVL